MRKIQSAKNKTKKKQTKVEECKFEIPAHLKIYKQTTQKKHTTQSKQDFFLTESRVNYTHLHLSTINIHLYLHLKYKTRIFYDLLIFYVYQIKKTPLRFSQSHKNYDFQA